MNPIDQYTDLYEQHRTLIDSHSAGPINALRPEAETMLRGMQLPRRGDENFANIDMAAILAPDYGLDLTSPDLKVDRKALGPIPEGVHIGSLRAFAHDNPEFIARHYGKTADLANPIVALDTLLARDGLLLHVAKGVRLSRPLQLVNILENVKREMAVRRVLVVIEDDAECRLLVCDHSRRDDVELLELETVEISVGARSRFDYCHIEQSTQTTRRLSALYMRQDADSEVNINGITLLNGKTRNEYYCTFGGEHGRLRLYGMGIGDNHRDMATYSHISHNVPNCHSDELFKYTVDDDATAAFTGRIYVAPGSVKTEAYQANRNLVGSSNAKIYSRPQLEIYNDDVKCSHGCAIGRLDPMQLFYMRTRGLDEATARLLLRQAFMSDVIDAIDAPAIRDRLRLLTERRFSGIAAKCDACKPMQ